MKKTMKALYTSSPNDFGLVEKPVPQPGPGQILIHVDACGICHTDILIREGKAPHVTYPFVPGHEYGGTVVACGEGVQHVKVGDRGVVQQIIPCGICRESKIGTSVYMCYEHDEMGCQLDGGMAEYCVLPERNFLPIPDQMTFAQGTFVEPMANAAYAMHTARIQQNDTVVVIGPGPIGIVACKIAKFYGAARVILVGTRDGRLALAKNHDFGVDEVVNIRTPGAREYLLDTLLKGRGADVVMEASGNLDALKLCFEAVGRDGRIVLEGTPYIEETVPFNALKMNYGVSIHRICSWREIDLYNCVQYIASGRINVDPLITHSFTLSEWEKGFELATIGKDTAMKVVLTNPEE